MKNLEALQSKNQKLREFLLSLKRKHTSYYYSDGHCPAASGYYPCSGENGGYCECGASEWNEKIDKALGEA